MIQGKMGVCLLAGVSTLCYCILLRTFVQDLLGIIFMLPLSFTLPSLSCCPSLSHRPVCKTGSVEADEIKKKFLMDRMVQR